MQEVSSLGISGEDALDDYGQSLLGIDGQAEVRLLQGTASLEDGEYKAAVITEERSPISFLFGGSRE